MANGKATQGNRHSSPSVGELIGAKLDETEITARVISVSEDGSVTLQLPWGAQTLSPVDGWSFRAIAPPLNSDSVLPDSPGYWKDRDGDLWMVVSTPSGGLLYLDMEELPSVMIARSMAPFRKSK